MLRKQLLLTLCILTGVLTANSQSLSPTVISSSGGSGDMNGTSLNWTTGELMVQTYDFDTISLTQGFHQGIYEITTSLDELNELGIYVNVYPNPVEDHLNVQFEGALNKTVRLKLMNLTGQVLISREMNSPATVSRLNMSSMTSGTYLLEIRINNKRKVFKIIKH